MAGFFLDEDILAFRYGEIYMDNVEIYNMSQIDTFKAAIRWENNLQGHSSVTNCAFHNGRVRGLSSERSPGATSTASSPMTRRWGLKYRAIPITW